nr:arylsulfatase [Tunicatimonas sp. TK19036]
MHRSFVSFIHILCSFTTLIACTEKTQTSKPPNIVIILADDLGYGDISCYSRQRMFETPHIDKLAAQGMRFTDAHSSSAVCTPTRYSLLTGRYAWRTRLQRWVLWQWDPPLIEQNQLTLPAMLQETGYYTAAVGKWHLGWHWPTTDGLPATETNGKNVDYSKPIKGGPLAYGFDYYYGDDVPNLPPYTFIENDRVVTEPTVPKPDSLFGRAGMMAKGWKLEEVMPTITRKAVAVIDQAAQQEDQPFFLYVALTAPHTPIAPLDTFNNKTQAGPYGDFVVEVDWSVGQVMDALRRNNFLENTLVIFTSDNGSPARDGTNFSGLIGSVIKRYGHRPNGELRGLKADIWEGGHRVPFIACWPGMISKNTINEHTICSIDIMATLAQVINYVLPQGAAEDSYNLLPLLQGEESQELTSRALIHHSGSGVFAVRKGDWKLILSDRSGGFSDNLHKDGYGINTPGQLYDLSNDLDENENLFQTQPNLVDSLTAILEEIKTPAAMNN